MSQENIQQSLSPTQAAVFLGQSVQTLANWRHLSQGPRYVKQSKSVRYRLQDLIAFREARLITPRES